MKPLKLTISDRETFESHIQDRELASWDALVEDKEAPGDTRRYFVKVGEGQNAEYHLINPYEYLSKRRAPTFGKGEQADQALSYYYMPSGEFEWLCKVYDDKEHKEPTVKTEVPLADRKNFLEMVALGGGVGAIMNELTAISPDHVRMLEAAVPMVLGPLGGLAHYYMSRRRMEKIVGRELTDSEKSILKKDAVGVSFTYAASYLGYTAGVEAAKFVMLALNIFPHTAIAHVATAIGLGLGMAIFTTAADLINEYRMHGKIISTPGQVLGKFFTTMAMGMAFYAMAFIPFSGFLKDVISPAMQHTVNKIFSLVSLALITVVATRTVALCKFLKSFRMPKEVKEQFSDALSEPKEEQAETVSLGHSHNGLFHHEVEREEKDTGPSTAPSMKQSEE